ncbi:MAG: hypothetical protein M0Z71_11775, partial [Nitrospiraceae bacterium]|nr:hypothetical protein [Nitrospiraceae bacterium]
MKTPLMVLHIEDSEDDALLVLRELRRCGYDPEVHQVQTAEEMTVALREGKWDVVISDYVIDR